MSSEAPKSGPLGVPDIPIIQAIYILTAVNFVMLGLNIPLTCISLYNSCTKQTIAPVARRILIATTAIMFVCNTTSITISLVFYTIQIPLLGSNPPNMYVLETLKLTGNGLDRVSFIVGDAIVAWRAWVLWSGSRGAHIILIFCTLCSIIGICIEYVYAMLFIIGDSKLAPAGPVTLVLSLPTLIVNLTSTCLIGYKMWLYRRDIKLNITAANKRTRIEKVPFLLVESGIIYCVIWVVWMYSGLVTYAGPMYLVVSGIWPRLLSLYPVLVTLLVSMEKMQLDPTIKLPTLSMPIYFPSILSDHNHDIAADPNTTGQGSVRSDTEQGPGADDMAAMEKHMTEPVLA